MIVNVIRSDTCSYRRYAKDIVRVVSNTCRSENAFFGVNFSVAVLDFIETNKYTHVLPI